MRFDLMLAAILPFTARTVFVQESIREVLLAVFAGAIVFGAVLSFMGVRPMWMKATSPEIADKIPEMSVFRPLALGILCIVGGILLINTQRKMDKVRGKR